MMLLVFLIPIIFLAYLLYYELHGKRKGFPPGPMPIPIFGNMLQLDLTKPHVTLAELSKQYGNIFTFWIGKQPNVVLTDFRVIKEALVKQGEVFSGRTDNYLLEQLLGGGKYGLFQSHGPLWKEQRRFALHVLRDFGFGRNIMEERILHEIQALVDAQIKQELLKGENQGVVDIEWSLNACVGNIINVLVVGYRFGYDDPKFKRLKQLLDDNFRLLVRPEMTLLQSFPWLRHLPLFGHFGFTEFLEQRDAFFEFFVQELREHKKHFDPEEEPTDFTSAYLKELRRRETSGMKMGSFNEWQLIIAIFGLWVAGLETTVTTLRWGFLYMLHYPDVQERCRAEIEAVLEDGEEKVLKCSDRLRTPFTSATLMEIQRTANILPLSPQHALLDDTKLEGHTLMRGTALIPSLSNVLIDPAIYPEPEKFLPERFLEKEGKSLKKSEEFVPFSMGKRQCLGESLARMELYLIFGTILQKFKLSVKPGSNGPPSLTPVVGLTFNTQPYEMLIQKL